MLSIKDYELYSGDSWALSEEDWAKIEKIAELRLSRFLCLTKLPDPMPDELAQLLANFIAYALDSNANSANIESKTVRNFTIKFNKEAANAWQQLGQNFADTIDAYSQCPTGIDYEATQSICGENMGTPCIGPSTGPTGGASMITAGVTATADFPDGSILISKDGKVEGLRQVGTDYIEDGAITEAKLSQGVKDKFTTETEARKKADKELADAISKTDAAGKETAKNLVAETEARKKADEELQTQVTANGQAIAQEKIDRAAGDKALDEKIQANTQTITGHTEGIKANAAAISANAEAIATNAKNIGTNTQAIAGNAKDIKANSQAIAGNTQAIAGNTENISKNADAIKANGLAISANTEAIKAETERATKAEGAISGALQTETEQRTAEDKRLADEIAKKQDKLTIDSEMSTTSKNPVENQAITKYIDDTTNLEKSAVGETITLTDAGDFILTDYKIDGAKSTQDEYKGFNNFNANASYAPGTTREIGGKGATIKYEQDGSVTLNGTIASADISYFEDRNYGIPKEKCGAYIVVTKGSYASEREMSLSVRGTKTDGDYYYDDFLYFERNGTTQHGGVYQPAEVIDFAWIRFHTYAETTFNNFNVKLMLSAKEESAYEPYVGGQPAPNPNYPQEIKHTRITSISDTGKQLVSKKGMATPRTDKDFWQNATPSLEPKEDDYGEIVATRAYNNLFINANALSIAPNSDYTLTIEAINNNSEKVSIYYSQNLPEEVIEPLPSGNFRFFDIPAKSERTEIAAIRTKTNLEGKILRLLTATTGQASTNVQIRISIYKGNFLEPTPYEPYKGGVYELSKPIDLYGLGPDEALVYDYVDRNEDGIFGVWRRIGAETNDGSGWQTHSYSTDYILARFTPKNNTLTDTGKKLVYSNYFQALTDVEFGDYSRQGCAGWQNQIKVALPKNIADTPDLPGLTKFFTDRANEGKPAKFLYILEKPYFEPLPEADQVIFRNLRTFKPFTVISTQGKQRIKYITSTIPTGLEKEIEKKQNKLIAGAGIQLADQGDKTLISVSANIKSVTPSITAQPTIQPLNTSPIFLENIAGLRANSHYMAVVSFGQFDMNAVPAQLSLNSSGATRSYYITGGAPGSYALPVKTNGSGIVNIDAYIRAQGDQPITGLKIAQSYIDLYFMGEIETPKAPAPAMKPAEMLRPATKPTETPTEPEQIIKPEISGPVIADKPVIAPQIEIKPDKEQNNEQSPAVEAN